VNEPWMILEPDAEGNYTSALLVVERSEYVKYLRGEQASFTKRTFTSREDAEENCRYRNRGWR